MGAGSEPAPHREGKVVLEKVIHDPEAVKVLYHEKKQAILKVLTVAEKKIVDLRDELHMNPGTVKRHLDDLVRVGLVAEPRVVTNEYGIKEKYYRATAKRFIIHIEWP